MRYAIKSKFSGKWLGADDLAETKHKDREACLSAYKEKKDRVLFINLAVARRVCNDMNGRMYAGRHKIVRVVK